MAGARGTRCSRPCRAISCCAWGRAERLRSPLRGARLLAGEPRARALVLGSALTVTLYAAAGTIAGLLASAPVRLPPPIQVTFIPPMLNEAALAAARLWVFKPALASNRPVAVWTAIPFNFRLH